MLARKMLVMLALVLPGACAEDDTVDSGNVGGDAGKADDADGDGIDDKGYHFNLDDGHFEVVADHAGAPLLATIWGRFAEYNREAPFVERSAKGLQPWVLHITKMFHRIHTSWRPSFEAMGLDVCDDLGINDDLLEAIVDGDENLDAADLEAEQCFAQSILWPDPDKGGKLERYRRTIFVALPDLLTIELDRPAAFPNGRVLHEQINSLMFALAFLDQGGECKDERGEVSPCNLHTLWRRSDFLKPFNDVPFRGATEIGAPAREFPFLADPHEMR